MSGRSMAVSVLVRLVDQMTGGLNSMTNRLESFAQRTQMIGRRMSALITTPLVGLATASFKVGGQVEESLNKIVGLVGVTHEQVAEWREEMERIGPDTGRSLTELADGMYFVASAGFTGADALDILEKSAQGAASGLGQTETIAHLVTSAMSAYGAENLNAAQATDTLVAAVREGKADAAELAGSIGSVLPLAAEMGVQFHEVGAAIAAMTRTGTDAPQAVTQLQAILAGLLKPAKQAEDTLAEMGTSSAELRRQIKDEGLLSAMRTLRDLTDEYGEDTMARVLPNIRALRGILDLMGANVEDNIGIFERMTDVTGSLDHAFETASQGGMHKVRQLIASSSVQLTRLSDVVIPAAIPMIQQLIEWIGWLGDSFAALDPETQQFIIMAAGIAAALGPALVAIAVFASLLGVLLSPIGLVVLGIAALVAAGIYLWRNWDEISAALQDVWGDFGNGVARIWGGIVNTVMGAVDLISSLLDGDLAGAGDAAQRMFSGLQEIGAGAMVTLAGAVRGMVRSFDNLFGTDIDGWISRTGAAIDSGLSDLDFSALVASMYQAGVEAGAAIVQAIKDAFDGLMEWFAGLPGRIIAAIGSIDLSGILRWPSMPSWLGGGGGGTEIEARAGGGPVNKGQPYLVGEKGWEIFVPGQSGTIIPHHEAAGLGGSKGFASMEAGSRHEVGGRIVVEAAEGTRVREIHSDNPDVPIEPGRGPTLGRP